ncbi:hypothetical protein REPUB_Repub20aG0141200 [Reevesia pubescens]
MVTTVFVNNIPTRVHWRWLWRIFENHGNVVDVFIPRKRNVRGKRFGFVRFAGRNEAVRAVTALNGAWLLDSRLGVNAARFNNTQEYWRKVRPFFNYTEKRSVSQYENEGRKGDFFETVHVDKNSKSSGKKPVEEQGINRTYAHVVQGKMTSAPSLEDNNSVDREKLEGHLLKPDTKI